MDILRQFSIPIKGLKIGHHEFNFDIDDQFFEKFEDSPIKEGTFELKCLLDKRADMIIFTFDFDGSFKTECDRCLANINLPIGATEDLILKYSAEDFEDPDVESISRDASEINIAKYVYEYICLSMPVTNIYDCEEEVENVCDLAMLKYLEEKKNKEAEAPKNPFRDALKDFNKDN